jgi:hypothetical protein
MNLMNRPVAQLCEMKTWSLWVVSCQPCRITQDWRRVPWNSLSFSKFESKDAKHTNIARSNRHHLPSVVGVGKWEIYIYYICINIYVYIYMCVCVDHLHRCKTSFGCSGFSTLSLQGVAADHLGPLPTKTPIWSGDTDWDANLRTCTNFHFRQWRPAKPSTGMSFGFSIFHYGLCCIWTFFRTSVSTGFIHCTVFAIWTTADFVRWNSCFVQGQRKNSSTLVFSPFHPTFACQILGDCLCTTDALHISNSIRYFWASVSLIPLSDKVVWALRGKPF